MYARRVDDATAHLVERLAWSVRSDPPGQSTHVLGAPTPTEADVIAGRLEMAEGGLDALLGLGLVTAGEAAACRARLVAAAARPQPRRLDAARARSLRAAAIALVTGLEAGYPAASAVLHDLRDLGILDDEDVARELDRRHAALPPTPGPDPCVLAANAARGRGLGTVRHLAVPRDGREGFRLVAVALHDHGVDVTWVGPVPEDDRAEPWPPTVVDDAGRTYPCVGMSEGGEAPHGSVRVRAGFAGPVATGAARLDVRFVDGPTFAVAP